MYGQLYSRNTCRWLLPKSKYDTKVSVTYQIFLLFSQITDFAADGHLKLISSFFYFSGLVLQI